MGYPKIIDGTKICITIKKEGIKVYGNRQAFKSLIKWMSWIVESDEKEHYEYHLPWNFESYESLENRELRNVWVLFDEKTNALFNKSSEEENMNILTFMAVENKDLSELENFKETGILPDNWKSKNIE